MASPSFRQAPSSSLWWVTSPSALYTNPRPNNSGTEHRPNTNGYQPNGNGYRPANGAQTFRPRCPRPSGSRCPQQLRSQPSLTQNPLPQPTLSMSPQQPTPTLPLPPPKSLPKLLKEHDLPRSLFPKKITGYKFDVNTRKITVNMPDIFYVFGLRFSSTVTGSLERGRLNHIKGIRMESLTWEEVHCIKIKFKKGKLHLHFTGNVDKVRRFDEFTFHVKFDNKK